MNCPHCPSQTNGGRGICLYCGGSRIGAKGNGAHTFNQAAQRPGTGQYGAAPMPGNNQQWNGNGFNAPGSSQQWNGNGYNAPGNNQQWNGNGFIAPGNNQQWNGNGFNAPGSSQQWNGNGNNAPNGGQSWTGNNNTTQSGGRPWDGDNFNAPDSAQPWSENPAESQDWNYQQAASSPGLCKGFPVGAIAFVIAAIKLLFSFIYRYVANAIVHRINYVLNGTIFLNGEYSFINIWVVLSIIINVGLFAMCIAAIVLGARGKRNDETKAKGAIALGALALILSNVVAAVQMINIF